MAESISEQTSALSPEQGLASPASAQGRWQQLTRLFRPPTLRVVTYGERHASWLELFFDLVFVVAVATLGHLLHDDLTAAGFATFAWLFVPVWFIWIAFSYYADQFANEDFRFRLIMLVAMLGVLVLSVNIDAAAHGSPTGFISTYVALRLLHIGLYAWARRAVPEARSLCTYILIGSSVSTVLWVSSLFVAEPYPIWAVALFVETVMPAAAHLIPTTTAWQSSHMPERLGLFTIIVLGEAILAVANGAADVVWDWSSVLTAVSGFWVAAAIAAIYFGYNDETTIDRALHGTRSAIVRGFIYSYIHLPIFAAIVVVSVAIGLAIHESHEASLHTGTRIALFGGMITLLTTMTIAHSVMPYGIARNVLLLRVAMMALFGALAWGGGTLPPLLLVGVAASGMIILILSEFFFYDETREAAPLHPLPAAEHSEIGTMQ